MRAFGMGPARKLQRLINRLLVLLALSFLLFSPSTLRGEETTASAQFADLKVGNVAEDDNTSRAVMEILQRCADAYKNVKTFHASGSYIEATKHFSAGEAQSAAKIEVWYSAPHKLRIETEDSNLSGLFLANGTTVTLGWPHERRYLEVEQPDALAAFSEQERAGEIVTDETNSIARSVVASLFITNDPLAWIHSNVEEYHYSGIEDVAGSPAYRIRFVQSNPDLIVINWIDTKSYLLTKVSLIRAMSEEGDFVYSYDEASAGTMRVTIYDTVDTTSTISPDVFAFTLPKNWKVREREEDEADAPQEGAWMKLFRAAAAETGAITSATVESTFGGEAIRVGSHFSPPQKVLSIAAVASEEGERLAVGLDNEELALVDANLTGSRIRAPFVPEVLSRATSGSLLVAEFNGRIARVDTRGQKMWQRQVNQDITQAVCVDTSQPRVYVSTAFGLITLDADGRTTFTSRMVSDLVSLSTQGALPQAASLIAASITGDIAFYRDNGSFIRTFSVTDLVQSVLLVPRENDVAVVTLGADDNNEPMLRQYDAKGSLMWSVGLTAAEDAAVAGLAVLRAPRQGTARHLLVALLTDGSIAVITPEGQPVWRGRVRPSSSAVLADENLFAHSLDATDLNANGTDELYVHTEAGVTQLLYSE